MRIEVEFGHQTLKNQVKSELTPICAAIEQHLPSLRIDRIIVSDDFEASINRLAGTTSYRSIKEHEDCGIVAVARAFRHGPSTTIVLSPLLYSESNDAQTRSFIFLHEVMHVINRENLERPKSKNTARDVNLQNLYYLYDEYLADFGAYRIVDSIFQEKSATWKSFIQDQTIGFAAAATDSANTTTLKAAENAFDRHRNIDLFLAAILPTIETVSVALTHFFSNIDYRGLNLNSIDLSGVPFINEFTIDLMDALRLAAEQGRRAIDDIEGRIVNFYKNFRIRYRDTDEGLFCDILEVDG